MDYPDSHRNDPAEVSAVSSLSLPTHAPIAGLPAGLRYAAPPFDPVPVQPRHDGWTPTRQRGFIEALAATGCVADAARAVGMTPKSAYLLRERAGADAFRAAWDAAMNYAVVALEAAVFSRAIHGVPVPHYHKGELVGEHRRYNDQLAMFLLRHNDLGRYAKGWDSISPYDLDGGTGPKVRASKLLQHLDALAADAGCDKGAEEDAPVTGRELRVLRTFFCAFECGAIS